MSIEKNGNLIEVYCDVSGCYKRTHAHKKFIREQLQEKGWHHNTLGTLHFCPGCGEKLGAVKKEVAQ